jgi:soluble lytic murein transglycosylase-like protein
VPSKNTWAPWALGAAVVGGLVLLARTARAGVSGGDLDALSYRWGTYFDVRPEILRRMLQVESGGKTTAVNLSSPGDRARGGAWGLMQVTRDTAREIAGRLERESDPLVRSNVALYRAAGPSALLNPDVGLMFGASHFASLLRSFGGNEPNAVGAYNRGATGMRSYLATGKDAMALEYVRRMYEVTT